MPATSKKQNTTIQVKDVHLILYDSTGYVCMTVAWDCSPIGNACMKKEGHSFNARGLDYLHTDIYDYVQSNVLV